MTHFSPTRRSRNKLSVCIERLEPRQLLAAQPIITEFLADNDDSITDGYGRSSDWIELYNAGDAAVDLTNWYLSDAAGNLQKWQFPADPAAQLDPGEYLVVFATGEGHPDPAGNLHTNFNLNANGNHVALTMPDGVTVVSRFGPDGVDYPPQYQDASYGIVDVANETLLLLSDAPAHVLIPDASDDANYGASWRGGNEATFAAAGGTTGWVAGTTPVGFGGASTITHIGNDLATSAAWRNSTVAKPLDGDGDAVYGTDGYFFPRFGAGKGDAIGLFRSPLIASATPSLLASSWSTNRLPLEVTDLLYETDVPDERGSSWAGIVTAGAGNYGQLDWAAGMDPAFASGVPAGHQMLLDFGTTARTAVLSLRLKRQPGANFRMTIISGYSPGEAGGDGIKTITVREEGQAPVTTTATLTSAGGAKAWYSVFDVGPGTGDLIITADSADNDNSGISGIAFDRLGEVDGSFSGGTDLGGSMRNVGASAYLRTTFDVADRAALDSLSLSMRYDDGFAAYLNGVLVARGNAPATLDHQSAATGAHNQSVVEQFNITSLALGAGGALRNGANVLAIHGLNTSASDADFFIEPTLVGGTILETQTRFFLTPTPGQPNTGGVEGIVADTQFNGELGVFSGRGFYDAPFDVTISTETPGATLVYTTDGSAPTLTNGTLVAPANADTAPSATVHVSATRTLRAAAFKTGFAPTNVDTQTYVFVTDVIAQPEMDFDIKNNPAYSGELRQDLTAIPSMSLVLNSTDMFGPNGIYTNANNTGPAWERAVSIEYLDPNSPDQFQIDGGIQIQGADSRNHQKKAFRLLFKEEYGAGKLDAPLFPGSPVDSFDRLVLRSGGHDAWTSPHEAPVYSQATSASFIRDEFIRQSQQAMGHLAVHGKFVHLYINGQYWGVYNLAELPDQNFASDHLGGTDADWDVIKGPDGGAAVADAGDKTAWNAMMAIAAAGVTNSAAYQQMQTYLDVDSFIDYMVAKIWAGELDWLHSNNEPQSGARNKNWFAVRNRTTPESKFQFLAWDSEFILGKDHRANRDADINVTDVDSADSPGQLYQALRGNAEFRLRFADRLQKHFSGNGALSVAVNQARWDNLVTFLNGPVVAESARWGDALVSFAPFTRNDHWLSEVAWIRNTFLTGRNATVLSQFEAIGLFPSVDAPGLTVSGTPQNGGSVAPGAAIGLSNPNLPPGTIYYTTDGTDPRQPPTVTSTVLVNGDTPAYAFGPRAANGGSTLGTTWTAHDFVHASWTPSPTGSVIGFDKQPTTGENYVPLLDLNVQSLADLAPSNASIYLRVPFTISSQSEIDAIDSLTLRMKYDDGFAAYINGQLVQSSNVPSPLVWNSNAPSDRPDTSAIAFQDFVLSQSPSSLLRVGTNILAIQALNRAVSSSDLLIAPELLGVQSGNDTSPAAQLYTETFTIDESTSVKARILRGTTWSALTDALFTVELPLRITELNYHPSDRTDAEVAAGVADEEDFEFVELQNIHHTATVELAGVRFTDGIEFTFGGDSLAPGERIVVARNRVAFEHRYGTGIRIAGEYGTTPEDYKFNNAGESVTLLDAGAGVIQSFSYQDNWHRASDGAGPTLAIIDPHAARELWNNSSQWRESYDPGGSPGERDRMIGDVNDDLRVNLIDLAILQSNFGFALGATWDSGDFNRDGAVNRIDVALLAARFGRSIVTPAASSALSTIARLNVEGTPPTRRLTARAARQHAVAVDNVLTEGLQAVDRPLTALRSRIRPAGGLARRAGRG